MARKKIKERRPRVAKKQIAGAGADILFSPEWQIERSKHLEAIRLDWQQTKGMYPNAVLMSATDDPFCLSVANLVSVISERLFQLGHPRPDRPTSKAKHDGTIEIILANAVQVKNYPDTWMAYYRKRGQYSGRGQEGTFSHDMMTSLIDWMVIAGFLEAEKSNGSTSGAGLCSKFRPTEYLSFLFDIHLLRTEFVQYVKGPIILKDANKKPVPLPDPKKDGTIARLTASAQAIADYVARLDVRLIDDSGHDITHIVLFDMIERKRNHILRGRDSVLGSDLCCDLEMDPGIDDDTTSSTSKTDILAAAQIQHKKLYRVFNESFCLGGRFYGHWLQSIPKELRKYATINGNRTAALDFSSIHLHICYARLGITPPSGDLYALRVKDFNRGIAKKVCLIAINSASRKEAFGALSSANEYGGWNLTAKQINGYIDAFIKKHDPIRQFFFSGFGTEAQYIDSQIAEEVMLHLIGEDIPCIPIHDGFIVEAHNIDILQDTMEVACMDVIGVKIPSKREH